MRHLLAVQAQDVASVPYALAARGGGFRDGLVVTWLMRATLHLVDVDDLAWLHPLFAPRRAAASDRRLAQLGVADPDALVERLVRAVPATRDELATTLGLTGQAVPHIIARAAMTGRVALTAGAPAAPAASGSSPSPAATAVPGSSLGLAAPDSAPAPSARVVVPLHLPPAPDRDASLDELARRYYACHAGADERDLAYWSGLPLRDCRPPASTTIVDGPVPDVLIPAFDELLLGWRDRSPTVPAEHAKAVHPGGGMIRAVALEDGVAVGTWTRRGGVVRF